jgi:hypothetical protein
VDSRLHTGAPGGQRVAFVLYELEEMDGPTIARLLDISENALWVRLHRARAAFEKEAQRTRAHRGATAMNGPPPRLKQDAQFAQRTGMRLDAEAHALAPHNLGALWARVNAAATAAGVTGLTAAATPLWQGIRTWVLLAGGFAGGLVTHMAWVDVRAPMNPAAGPPVVAAPVSAGPLPVPPPAEDNPPAKDKPPAVLPPRAPRDSTARCSQGHHATRPSTRAAKRATARGSCRRTARV